MSECKVFDFSAAGESFYFGIAVSRDCPANVDCSWMGGKDFGARIQCQTIESLPSLIEEAKEQFKKLRAIAYGKAPNERSTRNE